MKSYPLLMTTLIAVAAVLPQAVHAERPLQTEAAEVLERGGCEFELASDRLRRGGERATDNGVGLGCGIGWRTQVGLELSRSRAGGESGRGAAFVGKASLWKGAGEDGPALTLAWALASSREGGRWQRAEDDLRLVATLPVGSGWVHANLGHLRERGPRRTLATWGVAYEHEGLAAGRIKLAPMVETFGDDRESPWLNLGLRLTVVPDRVLVNLSWGRQTGDARPRLATAALKLVF